MSNALKVFEAKRTELELTEDEILLSIKKGYEEFFFIGNRLRLIRLEKRYRQLRGRDGKTIYPSWEAYCKSGRLPYKRTHADRMIEASKVRDEIGENVPMGAFWSERSIRPLTEVKGKEKRDKAAKDAMQEVIESRKDSNPKKHKTLTAALVKKHIDAITSGSSRAKQAAKKKQVKELQEASPAKVLQQLIDDANKHEAFFRNQEEFFWTEAEREKRGIAERAAKRLEALAKYLRS